MEYLTSVGCCLHWQSVGLLGTTGAASRHLQTSCRCHALQHVGPLAPHAVLPSAAPWGPGLMDVLLTVLLPVLVCRLPSTCPSFRSSPAVTSQLSSPKQCSSIWSVNKDWHSTSCNSKSSNVMGEGIVL